MARYIENFVIHHSATDHGTVDQFRVMHKQRGFADIGYHYLIGNGHGTPDGHIGMGRDESKDGAGVYGNNKQKLHVCIVGNFEKGHPGYTPGPSRRQMSALGHLLMAWAKRYQRKDGTFPKIVGHREITVKGHATACPGNTFPLKQIRLWYDVNSPRHVKGETFTSLNEFLGIQD
jgi:N-acetyl-anhydromuramyl-L-alanine amidase AmpD